MDFLLVALIVLGLLFDYTNGFHDAANVVATVIATKVLRPLVAIGMAAVLNTIGAMQISGIARTIATGIVNIESANLALAVCALIGAIFWNFATWYFEIPSSSSYALIGGMIGAGFSISGGHAILWYGVISKVLIPMLVAPFAGLFLSFLGMKLLHMCVKSPETGKAARVFRHLQIGSACIVALAHGLNDAQKSMGIITLGLFASGYIMKTEIPFWVVFSCALVMGLGTASGGRRIIRLIAYKITDLVPAQGFTAELSSSIVILLASFFGMPLSSTQIITGSVAGVGAVGGMHRVRWSVTHRIAWTWVFTLPVTAGIASLAYSIYSYFQA
jgi:PiT family inorganic phosphate transporter